MPNTLKEKQIKETLKTDFIQCLETILQQAPETYKSELAEVVAAVNRNQQRITRHIISKIKQELEGFFDLFVDMIDLSPNNIETLEAFFKKHKITLALASTKNHKNKP